MSVVAMENGAGVEGVPLLDTQPKKTAATRTFERTLGVIFLVLVALIWTFASVLVQFIFKDLGFDRPFFLTYIATSLFAINLPLWYIARQLNWVEALPTVPGKAKATLRQTFQVSKVIAPVWFFSNYAYNVSLGLTSVTSSTVVSSTSSIFTFLLSVCLLKERFTWPKLIGVALCVLGNITTVWNENTDSPDQEDNVLGDLLALLGAALYGLYCVLIHKSIPFDEFMSIPLFFGFIGLLNAVILFPVLFGLNFMGYETLSGLTWEIMALLVLKGLLDNVFADYLWARAVVLTSPTVATIGLSLTIPLAIISDGLLKHLQPTVWTYVSAALVIAGFILINWATSKSEDQKK